jgi:hypothetical protein
LFWVDGSEEKENKKVSQLEQTGCRKKLTAGERARLRIRELKSEEKAKNASSVYRVSRDPASSDLYSREHV